MPGASATSSPPFCLALQGAAQVAKRGAGGQQEDFKTASGARHKCTGKECGTLASGPQAHMTAWDLGRCPAAGPALECGCAGECTAYSSSSLVAKHTHVLHLH